MSPTSYQTAPPRIHIVPHGGHGSEFRFAFFAFALRRCRLAVGFADYRRPRPHLLKMFAQPALALVIGGKRFSARLQN